MSVGRPRWTSPPTCSIACRTWDARAPSASPDPDGVGGSATAALIRAPRCLPAQGHRDDVWPCLRRSSQMAGAGRLRLLGINFTPFRPNIAGRDRDSFRLSHPDDLV